MRGEEALILILSLLVGFMVIFGTVDSKHQKDKLMKDCNALYTTYAKTTADTLWFVDGGICPAPAKVRSHFIFVK